ncbi:HlyD family efflux transporter periplasmic adaptor subunit [Roseomonas sp. SG15]|uniref:HlyD family efflux transporter periplasmic adaptor subunit n=1 Tax=Roseomonas indoligenes TaxID=2820811 RepID=A0A940MXT4_9PROT|nr:HlyD family efflux transporter periplasmic adaptor subunit [Pararoseomonas indoligenes]MBP0496248.1 HlyD family efflux transporter periplasmic adaptor subunit [Pararoseomonas indoligenes]
MTAIGPETRFAGRSPVPQAFTALQSPSGNRRHPRVRLSARLEMAGDVYAVRDWSLGGAALDENGPPARPGDLLNARLLIGDPNVLAAVQLRARILRVRDGRAVACEFCDMAAEDSRLLDQLTQIWLGGRDVVTVPAALPAPPGAVPGRRLPGLRMPRLGLPALLALGFGLLLLGGGWVASQRMAVYSDFAAVAQPMRVLRAPQAGNLPPLELRPGTALRQGQALVALAPVVPPQVQADLAPRLQAAEARLRELEEERAQARAGFETFRLRSEATLRAAVAARQLSERQVATQERILQRFEALARHGILSQVRADQEEVLLLTLRRGLAEAQSAEAAARHGLNDALGGRFTSDGRPTQRSPEDIEREARGVVATRDELRSTLAGLTAPVPLRSPCDCTVVQVTSAGGAFVSEGEVLLGLAERGASGPVEIDALVPSGRMAFLRQGQAVRVQMAGSPDPVTGRIAAMNLNAENAGRIGLPDNLRSLKPYGLVTVALDAPAAGRTGTPALLVAPISIRLLLQQLPGLSWFVTEGRGAAAPHLA